MTGTGPVLVEEKLMRAAVLRGGSVEARTVRPMLGRTVGLGEVPAALDAARDANEAARIVVVP
jgi:hypothetical protein